MLTTAANINFNGLTSMFVIAFIIVTEVTKRNYKNCTKQLTQMSKTG